MNPMETKLSPVPQIWGHRGAMDFAPQNTIASFLLAQDQGADGVELDVQLTKDKVLVVFHDAQVDALTDGKGPISSLTWDQVKRLDAGSHFGPMWKDTRIPTLEEVLASLSPRTTVNIELKTALSEEAWYERWLTMVRGPRSLTASKKAMARAEGGPLAEAVARLIGQSAPEQFVISSFDPFALEAFLEWMPRIPASASIPLGFLHSPTVPWDTPAAVAALPYRAWHPHHTQVNAQAVAQAHAAGRRVNVWTVNDGVRAQQLARDGVDALITNRPAEIRGALTKG